MVVHHNTTFGYKRLHTHTQLSGNKYVSSLTVPLKTPQCCPFRSKTLHHTQHKEVKRCCHKSADVDSYVRVGRNSMQQWYWQKKKNCARTLPHFKAPCQPPLKKWPIIYFSCICHQRSIKKKEKKKDTLASVVNNLVTKSWYTLRRHHQ